MNEQLEKALGVYFQNPELLRLALTHRSYIYETPGAGRQCNERLEFLGDSVLGFITNDFLYRTFSELDEGVLSDVHAKLTRTETLAEFALELQLHRFLLLGKGEQQANNNERSGRYVANAFEAVLGAIYLDQDIEAVKRFLLPRLDPVAHEVVEKQSYKNNKNLFQELAQKNTRITPSYRIISQQGPSHDKKFAVEVLLGENVVGKGQGITRKEAEQDAAKVALSNLGW